MEINGIKVNVDRWWIEDVLERRITKFECKIEDLFFVTYAPVGLEGDSYVETKYGKLLVFFSSQCPETSSYILHKSKYQYPSKGNPFENLPNEKMDPYRELIS